MLFLYKPVNIYLHLQQPRVMIYFLFSFHMKKEEEWTVALPWLAKMHLFIATAVKLMPSIHMYIYET